MNTSTLIVVVEDEPAVNRLITLSLQRRGYLVASTTSGIGAACLLEHLRPDLVVTDVVMETPDAGLVLVQQLRNNPALANTGVLICSDKPLADTHPQASSLRPRERFIAKPFAAGDLLECVRSLLQGGA